MLSQPAVVLRKVDHSERTVLVPPIRVTAGQVGLVVLSDDQARMALIRHIAGLSMASSLGWRVEEDQRTLAKSATSTVHIGLIYENAETQFSGLFNGVTSELLLPLAIAGASREFQRLSLSYQLAVWGLTAKRHAALHELSDGQKQRLLLSSMFLANNDVVLSDGNLGYIDPIDRARLLAFMKVHLLATDRAMVLFATAADKVSQDLIDFTVRAQEATSDVGAPMMDNAPASADAQGGTRSDLEDVSVESLAWRPPGTSITLYGGLSFTLRRGQTVLVTGSNGSGKSSLGYLLSGIEAPSAGRILVSGNSADHWRIEGTPQIRIAPADPDYVLGEVAVRDEITWSERSVLTRDHVKLLKEMFGIVALETANPFSLSWHQRRHVAVLQAIAGAELAVFLDEPTAEGSDEDVERMERVIAFCASRGVLVICASNDFRFTSSTVFDTTILLPAPIETGAPPVAEQISPVMARGAVARPATLDTLAAWQSVANAWIANTGEFCLFWTRFVYPELTRLLSEGGVLPPAARLFDLGCGSGLHTRAVRSILSRAGCRITKTVGIDFVDRFIEVANFSSTDPDNETFLCADLGRLELVDRLDGLAPGGDEAAVVTAFFSLHDLSSIATVSTALARLKKSGSVFVAVIISPDFVEQAPARHEFQLHAPPEIGVEGRDWTMHGLFRVSSDAKSVLTVPYFHRSTQQYVEMLEAHWGPVHVHARDAFQETTGAQAVVEGCRKDEIVFFVSRVE